MNAAHWHLVMIHFPIAGTIFTALFLLAAAALKNETLKRTGLVLMVLCALAAFLGDQTGEKAAFFLRGIPDIDRSLIHEHSQAAEWAVRSTAIGAVLAILGLLAYRKHGKLPAWSFWAVTAVAIWASTIVVRVGYLGGHIRHPETQADFVHPAEQAPAPTPAPAAKPAKP